MKSSPYKVHHFQVISLCKLREGPCFARDNLTIMLNGDAIGLQAQGGENRCEIGWRREFGKGAGLAVELNS